MSIPDNSKYRELFQSPEDLIDLKVDIAKHEAKTIMDKIEKIRAERLANPPPPKPVKAPKPPKLGKAKRSKVSDQCVTVPMCMTCKDKAVQIPTVQFTQPAPAVPVPVPVPVVEPPKVVDLPKVASEPTIYPRAFYTGYRRR